MTPVTRPFNDNLLCKHPYPSGYGYSRVHTLINLINSGGYFPSNMAAHYVYGVNTVVNAWVT